ncbi:protein hu-li tai shao-like isoform X3 [Tubulanus polymorphus]|uniref:protein hu-li tai shao-like isoform X3 n=1 Tax=Tubulanus polymorphus TaxID=672921 RepID=UPI003DA57049
MTEAQVNGPENGGKFIDSVDPDDPEYQKNLRRPAEIKEDVRQMEANKRVSLILSSEAFREELEEIIETQIRSGPHPASLIALQQISELLVPTSGGRSGAGSARSGYSNVVIPISDIRGVGSLNYSKQEKSLRNKVAACYRLVDMFGWSQNVYNHITARISQDTEHFLINPFGLLYHEITASTLVKIDMRGEVLDPGSTTLGVNKAGWMIHSAIHQGRPDIKAIIHIHTPAASAVSAMKCGLLPISQEALVIGGVSYHSYEGICIDAEEKETLQRDLGPINKVMILRNHGAVACGETIEEAFHYARNLMEACETQVRLAPIGLDNLIQVDEETQKKVAETASKGGGGVNMKSEGGRKWRIGELEFEALMRQLDNAGYRTGYQYHQIISREPADKGHSDVEIPPATSSLAYQDDDMSSPLKLALEKQKKSSRKEWLVSTPNTYMKTQIEETGTSNPKLITKWVAEGDAGESPAKSKTGETMKLENPNSFAPQGENPKELRAKQQQLRNQYYTDKISAGPQSRILEGTTWEEARRMQDGNLSGAGDVVVVGAASKGIIQREHQHNAVVYRSYFAPNPFESMTDEDIQKYKDEIDRKNRGDAPEVIVEGGTELQQETNVDEFEQGRPKSRETNIDDVLDAHPEERIQVSRSQSARVPAKNREREQPQVNGEGEGKPRSPAKSDTLKSTDTEGGHSAGSPSKEHPPTEDSPSKKEKKKKFRMPSFSKTKKKEKK